MKTFYLMAASALALSVGACAPKTPPARAALDCPTTQGDLTRTAVAPDGKACTYVTSGGAEVTLQLVSTAAGGPDAALSAIEKTLLANRAPPAAADAAKDADAKADVKVDAKADAKADAKGEAKAGDNLDKAIDKQVDRAVNEALEDTKSVSVHVDVRDSKGVVTGADGKTRVNLPGIHIVADEENDTADVRVGPLTVKAGDDSVDLRIRRDVRLRGEALNPEKRGIRATFVYTGKDLPDGYRFVGYEAGGPKAGPITVAIVKSKEDHDDGGDDIYPDVKRLVRKNGGV